MRSRWAPAGVFFLAGIAFLLMVERLSTVACNDACPAWFAGVVMGQLLLPIAWAVVGYMAPRNRRIVWFFAIAAISGLIAYGLHLQILSYTIGAISG